MRTTDGVERAAFVLEILADARRDLGVTEIARALGVHKATASRILGTLAGRRLVERVATTGRYRIGVGLIRLAGSAMAGLDVIHQARPVLEELSDRTTETVNLGVMDEDAVLYVDQVTGGHAIVMANWVGRRSPVHCSSSGKVLLAFGEEAQRERILRRPMERLTKNTITDPDRLRAQLAEVRRSGYARSVGELEDGLNTVAAPVWTDGRVVAAVSISGPSFRVPARHLPRLGRLAADAGEGISRRMGHRGGP
ncbi:MAG: IclR family transcriptional regulator [Actinobacteria bacterium]|nr:IclR family transcriptional regulator [Actinomycetota bacterium]